MIASNRSEAQDRDLWSEIIKKAMAHNRLKHQNTRRRRRRRKRRRRRRQRRRKRKRRRRRST
jgi:hypothetical protein